MEAFDFQGDKGKSEEGRKAADWPTSPYLKTRTHNIINDLTFEAGRSRPKRAAFISSMARKYYHFLAFSASTSTAFFIRSKSGWMYFIVEYHGCASPETMREYIALFGPGRGTFPNGDGTDSNAQGINDGRPFYTEPSLNQAREMGRMIKAKDIMGYIYKNRSLRGNKPLTNAKFDGVRGLAEGVSRL